MKNKLALLLAFGVTGNSICQCAIAREGEFWWPCLTKSTAQQDAASEIPSKSTTNSIRMRLVLIPAGEFLMGSHKSPSELEKIFDEKADNFRGEYPLHRVRVSKPFHMGECEVTVGQFRRFVNDTGYRTNAETNKVGGFGFDKSDNWFRQHSIYSWKNPGFEQSDDHPVVLVSWNDATAFCQWLSRKERVEYSLPTEAQWEYACRAGSTTLYSNGDDPDGLVHVGNVADNAYKQLKLGGFDWGIDANDGVQFTSSVGQYRANQFGLYDMHGNVWELCKDWYDRNQYKESPRNDPYGPAEGTVRVVRGGGWHWPPGAHRSANRNGCTPSFSNCFYGFRVVRLVE